MAMGTFTSDKVLIGDPKYIPQLAKKICDEFRTDGFETSMESTTTGGYDVSLYKGGLFKAIIGLKSALKVMIIPQNGNIYVKASIGIFGQQAIPTAVTLLIFWPVLITQVWGMVQQSKLDDKAVNIAEVELNRLMLMENTSLPQTDTVPATDENENASVEEISPKFCPNCGAQIIGRSKFCVNCGTKL